MHATLTILDATPCAHAALPHATGPDCDEWPDGRCHAACRPERVTDWQGSGEAATTARVTWLDGDWCGQDDCPRMEEERDDTL